VATTIVQRDARRLRRSSTVAGVGDGVVAVALPLLAANLTRDPLAIAMVVALQHAPWVLVHAGWRFLHTDRRTVVGLVDTMRAVTLGMLGLVAIAGKETVLDIQLAAVIVGLGEALTDGTETETDDVSGLSARGMLGMAVVGLPLGGVLYEIFPATPFLFEVFAFAFAALFALLVRRPVIPAVPVAVELDVPRPPVVIGQVTLSASIAALAASSVLGVLVLFALDDLGLGAPAFGGLLAGMAVATAAGGFVAPDIGKWLGIRTSIVLGLLVAGAGHAAASQVADPDRPLVAALALGVAAAASMAAAVLLRSLLPARRPDAMRRFHLTVWSAIPLGALVGGWIARRRSVHEVLLWAAAAWVAAAIAAFLTPRPVKSFDE
jgi:hypothetical protein